MDALLELLNGDLIFAWLGELFQSEVSKMTLAFMVAARLHRSWVKKDMTEQFSQITQAINNVADTVSRDIALHSKRLDDLSVRVENLEKE